MGIAHGNDSAPKDSLLSIDDLCVRMPTEGGDHAGLLVDGVRLRVGREESVGIVGESGSGKSLTALSVLGLLPKNLAPEGSVVFRGRELLGARKKEVLRVRGSGMSLLMQDPGTMLNPLRRGVSHVEEGLARHHPSLSKRERRMEALRRLMEVGIDAAAAHRYPFQISGGMAQRIGLAASLAGDPQLLVADEPTTALDVTTQREILSLLRGSRDSRGMSLMLITHDLRVAFEVCDRVYVMYAGSVLEEGSPQEIVERPLHPYTRALLLAEPTVAARRQELYAVPGSVPRASEVKGMCSFAPRCSWRRDECLSDDPPLLQVAGRQTACVRIDEIRAELELGAQFSADISSVSSQGLTTDSRPVLRVSRLTKQFGGARNEVTVLRGVDLSVGAGQSVGLVGESGSGKSTLARCIVGLESPSAGSIQLGEIDVSDYRRLSPKDRARARSRVQMIFQNPYASLNPARSVGSTLREAVGASERKRDDVRGRVAELLGQVGLPANYANRKPAGLSGGERQRVAIARALAVEPQVLVCDEPTSALDVSVQAQIINLLRRLQSELGLALLFITHDLAVVRQVADHLYVISRGEFVESGETGRVLDSPEHEYTRLLLQSVAKGPAA